MPDVASLRSRLIDLEAELRQLGCWQHQPPSADALRSEQPFCVDTLTFPQWLQFIFLPRMYALLEAGEGLPGKCGIAPMAEQYLKQNGLTGTSLIDCLMALDELLSAG